MEQYWWTLEHVTTGIKFRLEQGENTLGRHSTSMIQMRYEYLSRKHVNLIVDGDNVILKPMEARNGVFINDVRINDSGLAAMDGDCISLGVPTGIMVPPTFGVFILKKYRIDNITHQMAMLELMPLGKDL